jgi:hypothetical protein
MNPTQPHQELIINIGHETEKCRYAIRLKVDNSLLAGLTTIEQLAHWMKVSHTEFTSDPKELPEGWQREARIPTWDYLKLAPRQLEKAA